MSIWNLARIWSISSKYLITFLVKFTSLCNVHLRYSVIDCDPRKWLCASLHLRFHPSCSLQAPNQPWWQSKWLRELDFILFQRERFQTARKARKPIAKCERRISNLSVCYYCCFTVSLFISFWCRFIVF